MWRVFCTDDHKVHHFLLLEVPLEEKQNFMCKAQGGILLRCEYQKYEFGSGC